jgi:orotate phosphoribosyltransferase
MRDYQLTFIDLAISRQALRFGRFTLKSGRESPYFFNAGVLADGEAIAKLGACYAAAIMDSAVPFDMLFGAAYKGIPLVTATAVALYTQHGTSIPYAFNRKETKDHGEGGSLVGSAVAGRVLIVDDVISAGTAVRESIGIIKAAGGEPCGIVHALDRQERGQGSLSALEEIEQQHGLSAIRIVTLTDIIEALSHPAPGRTPLSPEQLADLKAYRERYGAA